MQAKEFVKELLDKSYSVFHAVKNRKDELLKEGFSELKEGDSFSIKKGGRYFIERNQTSIISFKIPSDLDKLSFQISATHNDSPSFKIKPNPIVRYKNLILLNTEPYGGGIYNTWMDRPLSFAGRVRVKGTDGIRSRLLNIDEDILTIPNLAIHFNRTINTSRNYDPSKDRLPLLGIGEENFDFNQYLKEKLGLSEDEKILSHDLFLYNREKPCFLGRNREFLSSPRLDDLSSAYSALFGFIKAKENRAIDVFASFDNEEVGSLTKQGANSTFLKDILERIVFALNGSLDELKQAISSSSLLSIDNAHANQPNHPEITDKTTDVERNKGVVVKSNANQSYTSDAYSIALLKAIADKAEVPLQYFTNRSDLRGGSTLGNLSNSEVSLTSVDLGIAQLARHSSRELCGAEDINSRAKLLETYFASTLSLTLDSIRID